MVAEINHAAKPGYDRETMAAVIRTYQAGRRAGDPETEIRERALAAFMALHPEMPLLEASGAVPYIIAWAAREHSKWFWDGCDRPYVDPRREPIYDEATGILKPGPCPPGARDSY